MQRCEDFGAKDEEEKEADEDEELEQEGDAPWCEEPPVPVGLADEDDLRIKHKLPPLLLLLLRGLLRLRLWLL
jgi:hypothetical protein